MLPHADSLTQLYVSELGRVLTASLAGYNLRSDGYWIVVLVNNRGT